MGSQMGRIKMESKRLMKIIWNTKFPDSIIHLFSVVRSWLARREFLLNRWAACAIQAAVREWIVQRRYQEVMAFKTQTKAQAGPDILGHLHTNEQGK